MARINSIANRGSNRRRIFRSVLVRLTPPAAGSSFPIAFYVPKNFIAKNTIRKKTMIFHIELASSIGVLILIGVILDLVGRTYCLNSANTNEQATSQIVLACSVIEIGIVVCGVLILTLTDLSAPIAISFRSICLGLLLLIVGLIGTAASIGFCGAISNNTGNSELRGRVVATRNAYILFVVFG